MTLKLSMRQNEVKLSRVDSPVRRFKSTDDSKNQEDGVGLSDLNAFMVNALYCSFKNCLNVMGSQEEKFGSAGK